MNAKPTSNFAHLAQHDDQLVRLGMLAERYFAEDPNTCLLKLRQLAEVLAQLLASKVGQYTSRDEAQPPPDTQGLTGELPETWTLASVAAFAECLDSRRVPIKKDLRKRATGRYPYYGANGQVDLVDDFIFDHELVLVTEDETFYGRTKPIAYRSSGRCWVNNHAHVLRARDATSADYLCYSLMYRDVTPWLTGTTGRAKLTQASLNALPIAVPSLIEQVEIVRRTRELLAFADELERRVVAARTLTQPITPSALAKAFRGDLVPQDPNDEPASALLERVSESQASVATGTAPRRATHARGDAAGNKIGAKRGAPKPGLRQPPRQ